MILTGLHHLEWMTDSIIPGIISSMKIEIIFQYVTVLEFALLFFLYKFPFHLYQEVFLQGFSIFVTEGLIKEVLYISCVGFCFFVCVWFCLFL